MCRGSWQKALEGSELAAQCQHAGCNATSESCTWQGCCIGLQQNLCWQEHVLLIGFDAMSAWKARLEAHRDVILLAEGDGCLIHDPQILSSHLAVVQPLVHLCLWILQATLTSISHIVNTGSATPLLYQSPHKRFHAPHARCFDQARAFSDMHCLSLPNTQEGTACCRSQSRQNTLAGSLS